MHRIILASASPRRKEILGNIVEDFEIKVSEVDERAIEEQVLKTTDDMVEAGRLMTVLLGKAKANAVFEEEDDKDVTVIGADTCVVTRDEILGKPKDREDARRMLRKLAGQKHYVITGVALISKDKVKTFYEETEVEFADADDFAEDAIERYIASDEPYDKAGAYAIQGRGGVLVKRINGDFYNVMGLPLSRLAKELWTF